MPKTSCMKGGSYNSAALRGGSYNSAALRGGSYNSAALMGGSYNSAALRGGSYNSAALMGGSYNSAALRGGGRFEDILGYDPKISSRNDFIGGPRIGGRSGKRRYKAPEVIDLFEGSIIPGWAERERRRRPGGYGNYHTFWGRTHGLEPTSIYEPRIPISPMRRGIKPSLPSVFAAPPHPDMVLDAKTVVKTPSYRPAPLKYMLDNGLSKSDLANE